jgi:endonuclease/exonuclease/phosphatase family metal-dependent hydrolase
VTVRVMTYNIWRGGRGGEFLDRAVRAAAPDVLLVNEAPKIPLWWRLRCRRLAAQWGMRYVAGGRNAGSNMVLTAPEVDVESTYVRTLPQPFFQPRRGIAAARLLVDGTPLGVVSCHLSLDQQRRLVEVEEVVEVARRLCGVVVVAGDLNEGPHGPCWAILRDAGFVDHGAKQWHTFPAAHPYKRIDALLVRGNTRVLHHGDPGVDESLQERASDHRAVLAVLDLPGGRA